MTSISPAYISPFPIECPDCSSEVSQDEVSSEKHIYKKERVLTIKCENCGLEYRIRQSPLRSDYTIEETEE